MSEATKTVYSIPLTIDDLIMLSSALKHEMDDYKKSIDVCEHLRPDVPEAAQTADFFRQQLEKAEIVRKIIDVYLQRNWHSDQDINAGKGGNDTSGEPPIMF